MIAKRRHLLLLTVLGAPWGLATLSPAASWTRSAMDNSERASHGEYLVRHVAMCLQCHTPRDEEGRLIEERLLQGAAMPIASPFPDDTWAHHAPSLAGLPGGWSEDELVLFLQTGQSPGEPPTPPMPPFRMSAKDARAVALYLRTMR